MSKIKDLATVTVDNAFRLVPVDQERYDLLFALGRWLDCIAEGANPLDAVGTVPVYCNWSLTDWHLGAAENVLQGAIDFRMVYTEGAAGMSRMARDRARRFEASLASYWPPGAFGLPWRFSVDRLVRIMWIIILKRMCAEPGFLPTGMSIGHRRIPI